MPEISLAMVQEALALTPPEFDPEEAQLKLAPSIRPRERPEDLRGQARLAATMLLLYPLEERLSFVLTRRPETLTQHAGQISFPGGRKEDDEDFVEAALRETCEELGICDEIKLLGGLTPVYIPPSDFYVQPFVGYLEQRPSAWRYPENEVAEVIECPLESLFDDALKGWDKAEFNGLEFEYGWYTINGHRVWGATAIMLSEFEWRLRTVAALSR